MHCQEIEFVCSTGQNKNCYAHINDRKKLHCEEIFIVTKSELSPNSAGQ